MSTITHTAIPMNASDHACVDLVNSDFSDYLGRGESVDRIESRQCRAAHIGPHIDAAEAQGCRLPQRNSLQSGRFRLRLHSR